MSHASALSSRSYRDIAIVLRTQQLGEADRIIIALTQQHGVVHAVARGVRRSSSKIGARLEPFMVVDLSLVKGKNLDTVSQVVTRKAYTAAIMGDYDAFTVACVLSELTEALTTYDIEQQVAFFNVLAGALSSLAQASHHPLDVLNAFALRTMALAGWSIVLDACSVCGAAESANYFSPEYGFVDAGCAASLADRFYPLSDAVKLYIRAVFQGRWEHVDTLTEHTVRSRSLYLVSLYVRWHLEKPVKTLDALVKDTNAR
ncbi:DNA repair protein RecO [Rothia sp. ZJ1223]|uniref:DNA repair protein RecO n=1 Tax=Rothia sp. ZJ1223 TaxID=2811098 RepID=UPI00195C1C38|nr:DNA repair protein RecO [Rothia sp. ZJ1223]